MLNRGGYKLDALGHYYPHMEQFQSHFLWMQSGITPGPHNATQGHFYARDFLDSQFQTNPATDWARGLGGLIDDYDYDISPINPGKSIRDCILNTPVSLCHTNLEYAANEGKVRQVGARTAQELANEGELVHVVSGPMNHEAIVCADENVYDPDKGPLLTQSGVFCGVLYMADRKTFGVYGVMKIILPQIGFFVYNKRS